MDIFSEATLYVRNGQPLQPDGLQRILSEPLLLEATMDAVWLHDLSLPEPSQPEERHPEHLRLSTLLQSLLSAANETGQTEQIVRLALERLDGRLLETTGLIDSAAVLQRRLVRANTNLFYRQAKYNLFEEESEGWARMGAFLAEASLSVQITSDQMRGLEERMLELIGFFSLDPNRVVDCILDAACASPKDSLVVFMGLLTCLGYPSERLAEIIGFKLTVDPPEVSIKCRFDELAVVVAMCILNGLVLIEDILMYVPLDKCACDAEFSAALNKLPMGSDSFGYHDIGREIIGQLRPPTDFRVYLFDGLLRTGQFTLARQMIATFGSLHSAYPPSWTTLAAVIESLLDCMLSLDYSPLYSDDLVVPSERVTFGWSKVSDYKMELLSWLSIIGPHLHVSATALCKLLQIEFDDDQVGLTVLFKNILPALSLLPPHPSCIYALWAVLSRLPYPSRYSIYSSFMKEYYNGSELGRTVQKIVSGDVKRLMRRLSRENVRPLGRLLGKLSGLNAAPTLQIIIDQIRAYENLIQPVIEALRYLGPFAFDVLSWMVTDCVASEGARERLKADGMGVAGWLQHIAVFTGSLGRRYPSSFDLEPLIDGLLKRLLIDGSGEELCVVRELVMRMTGVEVSLGSVNEAVLECSFGGRKLRGLAWTSNNDHKATQRAANRLLSVLSTKRDGQLCALAWLWIGLARQPTMAVRAEGFGGDELKAQSHAFDTAFETFAIYCEFINSWGTVDSVEGVPSAEILTERFGISESIAWYIQRCVDRFKDTDSQSFLSLSIHDVYVPSELYSNELSKLKATACNPSISQKQREEALSTAVALEDEGGSLEKHVMEMILPELPDYKQLIRRAVLTPMDAALTGYYLKGMFASLDEGTVREMVSSLCYLDPLLSALSEREAICYGRFLYLLLSIIVLPLNDKMSLHLSLYKSLHSALTRPLFIPLRNAILLLTRLDGQFPIYASMGMSLELAVKWVHEREEREDLRVLATRCQAILSTAKPRLINPDLSVDEPMQEDESVGELVKAFAEINASVQASAVSSPIIQTSDKIEEGEHVEPVVRQAEKQPQSPRKRRSSEDLGEPVAKKRTLDTRADPYRPNGDYRSPRDRERDSRERERDSREREKESRERERGREREWERQRERDRRDRSYRSARR